MLTYERVIEKTNAYKILNKDFEGGRLSHAYLIKSIDLNFLSFFAEFFSAKILSKNSENAENIKLRVSKHSHPDVMFYGAEKAISSETVSEIIDSCGVKPFEADIKIFVILNFQDVNVTSQNKILKIIEEPPQNTHFFLCATDCSKILQTIMSRVKLIEVEPFSTDEIEMLLKQTGISEQNAQIYASCSGGNGTFAEKLATDDGFIDFYNKIVSMFFDVRGSRDVLAYSNYFNQKNIDKGEFFDISMMLARDISMIMLKKEQFVVNKIVLNKLKVVASTLNLDATNELIKTCINAKKSLNFNVNLTAVVDNFIFKLAEVKVKCKKLLGWEDFTIVNFITLHIMMKN